MCFVYMSKYSMTYITQQNGFKVVDLHICLTIKISNIIAHQFALQNDVQRITINKFSLLNCSGAQGK